MTHQPESTIIDGVIETIINNGIEGLGEVFTLLFNWEAVRECPFPQLCVILKNNPRNIKYIVALIFSKCLGVWRLPDLRKNVYSRTTSWTL